MDLLIDTGKYARAGTVLQWMAEIYEEIKDFKMAGETYAQVDIESSYVISIRLVITFTRFLFYKNHVYKNIEAQISQKIRTT